MYRSCWFDLGNCSGERVFKEIEGAKLLVSRSFPEILYIGNRAFRLGEKCHYMPRWSCIVIYTYLGSQTMMGGLLNRDIISWIVQSTAQHSIESSQSEAGPVAEALIWISDADTGMSDMETLCLRRSR